MKRLALGLLATGGVLTSFVSSASAQTWGTDDRAPYESRQNFLFELRAGNYFPHIDSSFNTDQGPFFDIFSTPDGHGGRTFPWYFFGGAEFDWQIVRIGPVMSLGVGLGAGYSHVAALAPTTASMTNPDPNTWTRSTEETAVNIVPITLTAVARFDGLARHFRYLPIVPYAKFGLAYGIWWITVGPNIAHSTWLDTTDAQGHVTQGPNAIGGSLGWTGAIGVAVLLDIFDPSLARQSDATTGINHSYAFFEGYITDLSGFTGRQQLNVGTTSWVGGLAVEF